MGIIGIYLNDSLNVYYGYGTRTEKGVYADTIYYTSKFELEKEFPFYDKMDFRKIRSKLLDYAYENFDFGIDTKITYAKDSICMTSDGILINTERKYKSRTQYQLWRTKKHFHCEVIVDRLSLEMISKRMLE